MTRPHPSLSDPDYASFAWRRYRQVMAWMALAAVIAVAASLAYLHASLGELNWPTIIATIAGIGLTVMIGAALMGLIFLSSGTGHDQEVADFEEQSR